MCIFEYDEEKEMRLIRKAEYEEGHKEGFREGHLAGEQHLLRQQVEKKLSKGKSPAQIADELEEELPIIESMIHELQSQEPEAKQ